MLARETDQRERGVGEDATVHREPEAGRALPFSLRPAAPRRQRVEKSRDVSGINCRTNHRGRPAAYPFRLEDSGAAVLGRLNARRIGTGDFRWLRIPSDSSKRTIAVDSDRYSYLGT